MKSGIAGGKQGVLLVMLLLAVPVKAQDDPDADFLDMLEFIGEFSDEDGEWSELELDLESLDAQRSPRDSARGDVNEDRPVRPEAGRAGQNSSDIDRETDTATEAP